MNPFFLMYGFFPFDTGNHRYLYGQSSAGVDRYGIMANYNCGKSWEEKSMHGTYKKKGPKRQMSTKKRPINGSRQSD